MNELYNKIAFPSILIKIKCKSCLSEHYKYYTHLTLSVVDVKSALKNSIFNLFQAKVICNTCQKYVSIDKTNYEINNIFCINVKNIDFETTFRIDLKDICLDLNVNDKKFL